MLIDALNLLVFFFSLSCSPCIVSSQSVSSQPTESCSNSKNDDNLTVMVSLDSERRYIDAPLDSSLTYLENTANEWCTSNLPSDAAIGCTTMVKTSLVSQQTARQQRTTVSFGATIDRGEPVTNLIIIDNFFDDPIAIRSFALQQDFNVKKDREGYNSRQKFRRTRSFSGDSIFRDVRIKIEASLGTRTVNFESVAGEGEHMS